MKIILLGSTSFTGSHILHQLSERYSFHTVGRQADVCDTVFDVVVDSVSDLAALCSDADFVVNCFSNGDVDSCEKNPAPSKKLNFDLCKDLCELQAATGFHLIHFSTNAVYDGDKPPYSESSAHLPVNTYGQLKSQADKYLLENSEKCTILRPITMYGQLLGNQRHNPFSFFFEKLKNHEDIVAVNDVYVNMLHVDVLVDCVDKVIQGGVTGEFNVSGDDVVNRFEFVSAIKAFVPGSKSTIRETDSSGFVTPARRPLNTSFDNSKMKTELGVHPKSLNSTLEMLALNAF